MTNFNKQIEELKKSPIFALSKCNNELAHSNFWAWLIEYEDDQKKHPFLKLFISDPDIVFDNVKREEKNRDLTIYYHKKHEAKESQCHIVENKLKSIPTVKQLERYEEEIEKQYKGKFKGTLTGIEETLDLRKLENWSFMSYDKLAQAIKEIVAEKEIKDGQVIEQYIKDIDNVSSVLKTAQQKLGVRWLLSDVDLFNKLEEVKLGDVFLKQAGCLLKKTIDERICEDHNLLEAKEWGIPKVDVSFFNKSPVVTIIYKKLDCKKVNKKGEPPELWRLGVQIQGKQFRIYGGPGKSITEKETNDLFNGLQRCGWFEEPCDKKIRGKYTSMKGGLGKNGTLPYCKYKTSQYTHIYQYWDIGNDETRDALTELVICELKKAKEIIDNDRINFMRYCS